MVNAKVIVALVGVVLVAIGLVGATGVVAGLCEAGPGCTHTTIPVSFGHSVSGYTVSVHDTTAASTGINSAFQQTWYWGDGNVTGSNPWSTTTYTHAYRNAGTYTVTLTDILASASASVIGEASAVIVVACGSFSGNCPITATISCNPSTCTQYVGTPMDLFVHLNSQGAGSFGYSWTGAPISYVSGAQTNELVMLPTDPAGSWTLVVSVSTQNGVVATESQSASFTSNTTCGGSGQPTCPGGFSVIPSCTPGCGVTLGQSLLVTLSITKSNGPFRASWVGSVPYGMSPSADTLSLSGTPTVAGNYTVIAQVSNLAGQTVNANVTIIVSMSTSCTSTNSCPLPPSNFNVVTALEISVGMSLIVLPWLATSPLVRFIGGAGFVAILTVMGYVIGGLGAL